MKHNPCLSAFSTSASVASPPQLNSWTWCPLSRPWTSLPLSLPETLLTLFSLANFFLQSLEIILVELMFTYNDLLISPLPSGMWLFQGWGLSCFVFVFCPVPAKVASTHWVLISVDKAGGRVCEWALSIFIYDYIENSYPQKKAHFQVWICINYTNLLFSCSVISRAPFILPLLVVNGSLGL